jgi:hypothetical protein
VGVVADTGNHRVLVRSRDPTAPATLVLGQGSFTDNSANRSVSPSAATMRAPEAAVIDGSRLVVADTGNHRVLVWKTFPSVNGQPADLVIGQADFASNQSNRGTGLATAATLALPSAVHFAGGRLFIADSGNNRVVAFDDIPTGNGTSASLVLGQPDFASRIAAPNGSDRDHLAGPVGLASDGTNLYAADRDAQRVVVWELASLVTSAPAASLLNASNGLVASGPQGLAVERTALFTSRLYLSDSNNDRILVLGSVSRLH